MNRPMNRLYYVTGYHWSSNAWWRFVITAPSQEEAADKVGKANDNLTRLSATFVCETSQEVFDEL